MNRLLAAFEEAGAIDRRGALVHCNVDALRRLAQVEPATALVPAAGGRDD